MSRAGRHCATAASAEISTGPRPHDRTRDASTHSFLSMGPTPSPSSDCSAPATGVEATARGSSDVDVLVDLLSSVKQLIDLQASVDDVLIGHRGLSGLADATALRAVEPEAAALGRLLKLCMEVSKRVSRARDKACASPTGAGGTARDG